LCHRGDVLLRHKGSCAGWAVTELPARHAIEEYYPVTEIVAFVLRCSVRNNSVPHGDFEDDSGYLRLLPMGEKIAAESCG
jgi:hypothetical protein